MGKCEAFGLDEEIHITPKTTDTGETLHFSLGGRQ